MSLRLVNGSDDRAYLEGFSVMPSRDGLIKFFDLVIFYSGDYVLDFVVTEPDIRSYISTSSILFTVPKAGLHVITEPQSRVESEVFAIQPQLRLYDPEVGQILFVAITLYYYKSPCQSYNMILNHGFSGCKMTDLHM